MANLTIPPSTSRTLTRRESANESVDSTSLRRLSAAVSATAESQGATAQGTSSRFVPLTAGEPERLETDDEHQREFGATRNPRTIV